MVSPTETFNISAIFSVIIAPSSSKDKGLPSKSFKS